MSVWSRYEDEDVSQQPINVRPAMDLNSGTIYDLGPPKSDKERAAWEKENPNGWLRLSLPSVDCVEQVSRGRGRYLSELDFKARQGG
jgi:hypothetical protein